MIDSDNLAEARAALDAAVKVFVQAYNDEHDKDQAGEEVFVNGWVAYAEYVTMDFAQREMSASATAVPDGQHFATSRGLFEIGTDAFRRG
jgi:hypothetical protein